jgi:hypothetical protein
VIGPEITSTKLWVDDVRRPPSPGWVWAKSVAEAIEVLQAGNVAEASFDHDLYPFERDGLEIVEWMVEHRVFPRHVRIHSANGPDSTEMCNIIERHGYRGIPGRPRHFVREDRSSMSPAEFLRRNFKYSPKANEKLR